MFLEGQGFVQQRLVAFLALLERSLHGFALRDSLFQGPAGGSQVSSCQGAQFTFHDVSELRRPKCGLRLRSGRRRFWFFAVGPATHKPTPNNRQYPPFDPNRLLGKSPTPGDKFEQRGRRDLHVIPERSGGEEVLGRIQFHLNNGQARAVKTGQRLGEDRVVRPKSLPEHTAYSRATQGIPKGVTQRIVSWGRSRDGSGFARGSRSVDTEGFCKSQMTLNSGLRWLRATLHCFRSEE